MKKLKVGDYVKCTYNKDFSDELTLNKKYKILDIHNDNVIEIYCDIGLRYTYTIDTRDGNIWFKKYNHFKQKLKFVKELL